jgi:hypothetical protein
MLVAVPLILVPLVLGVLEVHLLRLILLLVVLTCHHLMISLFPNLLPLAAALQ